MRKQRGITLTGLIVILVVLGMAATLGFKLFNPYMQYFTIKKTFKTLAQNPELKSGNRREVGRISALFLIDSITSISEEEIEV